MAKGAVYKTCCEMKITGGPDNLFVERFVWDY